MDDIYKYIKEYNPNNKRKILTVFDMTPDMLSNKMHCKTMFFFR